MESLDTFGKHSIEWVLEVIIETFLPLSFLHSFESRKPATQVTCLKDSSVSIDIISAIILINILPYPTTKTMLPVP